MNPPHAAFNAHGGGGGGGGSGGGNTDRSANKRPWRLTTPVATAGDRGAAYALIEHNWPCPKCKHQNVARARRCKRCRARKPAGGGGYVHGGGATATTPGAAASAATTSQQTGTRWREAVDPTTHQM